MSEFYQNYDKFYVAVDCIIFGFESNELKLLLINRNFEPCKGELSLMGGFLGSDESVDQAAARVLQDLTGLQNLYMEQVGIFGDVDRDPGERVLSAVYYALINIEDYDKELASSHNAVWIPITSLPNLVFDHEKMVDKAIEFLRNKAMTQPIGFNMLPEYFTLTQLQMLYEAINGEPLDKRNFRKRIAEMDFLEKTEMVDKTMSKRGAALYRFNEKVYLKEKKFKI